MTIPPELHVGPVDVPGFAPRVDRWAAESEQLVTFLEVRMAEDEVAANAAEWDGYTWIPKPCHVARSDTDVCVTTYPSDAKHIARWDPPRVLAHCSAQRVLIADLLAETHQVVEDCWYTCAAATEEHDGEDTCDDTRRGGPCDCGRDFRLVRRLRILAQPYAGHADYPKVAL